MALKEELAGEVTRAIGERLRAAGIPESSVEYPLQVLGTPEGLQLRVSVEDPLRLGVDASVAKALAAVGEFLPDFVWKRHGMVEREPSRPLELSGRTYGREWRFLLPPRR